MIGNHDVSLDRDFYAEHGSCFHGGHPEYSERSIKMFEDAGVTYLNHDAKTITLMKSNGPQTTFKVFGSPMSLAKGLWAFGYRPESAFALWEQIPLDADIVITHTPSKDHCDKSGKVASAGCEALRQVLWRNRPRLAVCGHIHEARGAERLVWTQSPSDFHSRKHIIGRWVDPSQNSKKQSLINFYPGAPKLVDAQSIKQGDWIWQPDDSDKKPITGTPTSSGEAGPPLQSSRATASDSGILNPSKLRANDSASPNLDSLERQETCIINAAIMASSWPYKKNGNRKYNKPIVVDIDLPILGDNALNNKGLG